MPKSRVVPPHPNQGSLLLPGFHGSEYITTEENSFPRYEKPLTPSEEKADSLPKPFTSDIVERNSKVSEALGLLGTIAETAPAVRIDEDPKVQAVFKRRFGNGYMFVAEGMAAKNHQAQVDFDELFKNLWGLEVVKKSGLLPKKEINIKIAQDRAHFIRSFSENPARTKEEAAGNRATYRKNLDRQRAIYRRHNLGVWPIQAHKKSKKSKKAA
jgi:hypothetical protein